MIKATQKTTSLEIVCRTVPASPARIVKCPARFAEDCDCGGRHEVLAVAESFVVELVIDGKSESVETFFDREEARADVAKARRIFSKKEGWTVRVVKG